MVAGEKGCEEGMLGSWMDMYTLYYLKWITKKNLLYSTGNSVQCHVQPRWEGSLGEDGYMCVYS